MDYIIVINYLCRFLVLYSFAFLLPLIPALVYGEFSSLLGTFLYSAFTVLGLGLVGFGATYPFIKGEDRKIQIKESLALVGLGWFFITILGGLPYYFSGTLSLLDGVFESVSGFSTTGASVIEKVELVPKGLLFWRAFTHFLGGMGIVVIFISVFPYLGVGGRFLLESESFAPDVRFIKPRIKETVRQILLVYILLTVIQTILLTLCGMSLFDAVCHSFATLSTGGFSTKNKSIDSFESLPIEIITIVFMLCGATNFSLMYQVLRGDILAPFKNTEWKYFIGIWLISVLLISLCLLGVHGVYDSGGKDSTFGIGESLRYSTFTFTSLFTCTGFTTKDYDNWHSFIRWYLMVMVIVGGCAGSTSGGIKVIRFIILLKMLKNRLFMVFQPRAVRAVVVGKQVVSEDIQKAVRDFFALWIILIMLGSLILCWTGLPIETSVSAVMVCLSGVGPGLDKVGGCESYGNIPQLAKVVLSLLMLMGRLELYTILVLFLPSFWWKK
ncbi:MAG: TrkH family potassium uptake protein [Candidatus Hydrogenedentes bacterium]|nr:TrkH family potassium uptake protein [Candidatus Hydrogenedentota bacterium]